MSFLKEPEHKPICCNQTSSWVVQTPTLHYFYCKVCKDEVDPVKGGKILTAYSDEHLYPIPKSYPGNPGARIYENEEDFWKLLK